jgi:hypothetical protein
MLGSKASEAYGNGGNVNGMMFSLFRTLSIVTDAAMMFKVALNPNRVHAL